MLVEVRDGTLVEVTKDEKVSSLLDTGAVDVRDDSEVGMSLDIVLIDIRDGAMVRVSGNEEVTSLINGVLLELTDGT